MSGMADEFDTRMRGSRGPWLMTVGNRAHDEGHGPSEGCDCPVFTSGLVFSQIMEGVEPYAL